MDRDHNTTRFVVLRPGEPEVGPDDDKTTIVFTVAHQPGALALALTELGLRGANLTRIESRPGTEAWTYRFFVDLVHPPGPAGLAAVLDPPPATLARPPGPRQLRLGQVATYFGRPRLKRRAASATTATTGRTQLRSGTTAGGACLPVGVSTTSSARSSAATVSGPGWAWIVATGFAARSSSHGAGSAGTTTAPSSNRYRWTLVRVPAPAASVVTISSQRRPTSQPSPNR